MVRKLFLILTAGIVPVIVGCNSKSIKTTSVPTPGPVTTTHPTVVTLGLEDLPQREKVANAWAADIEMVGKKSGNKIAQGLATYFSYNSLLAKPHERGMRVMRRAQDRNEMAKVFILVPLIKGDESISPSWRNLCTNQNFAATFASQALILRATPMTAVWRGIVGIHETYHAWEAAHRPSEYEQNEYEFCNEEMNSHQLQNELVQKLGGNVYREVLKKEVARLVADAKKHKYQIGERVPTRLDDYPMLDIAFGKPLSTMEAKLRGTSTWIHAEFTAIDLHGKGDEDAKNDAKRNFLMSLYRQSGLIR